MGLLLAIFIIHLLTPGPSFFFLMLESMLQGRAYGVRVARGLAVADLLFASICAFAFFLLSGLQNSATMAYLMIAGGLWFIFRALKVLFSSQKKKLATIDEASHALAKESLSPKYSEELEKEVEEAKAFVQLQKEIEGNASPSSAEQPPPIVASETENTPGSTPVIALEQERLKHAFATGVKAGIINVQAILFFLAMAVAGGLQAFSWEKKLLWIALIAATSFIIRQSIALFFTTNKIFNFFKNNQILIQSIASILMIIFASNVIYSAYQILVKINI